MLDSAVMIVLRHALTAIILHAAALAAEPAAPVPAGVAAYRAELDDPDKLAEEIIRARREKERSNANPLVDIAFSAMRTEEQIEKALADGIQALDTQANAALEKRQAGGQEPEAHRAEAKLWERLARLHNAANAHQAALKAGLRRLESLVRVATPEEWLIAALDAIAAYQRAGKEDKATEWFDKCKQLVADDPTLRNSAPAKARLRGAELRMAARPGVELGEATADIERTLGANHPETIACIEDAFVATRQSSADIIEPGKRLIAAREAVCGPAHPATLRTAALVGSALFAKGKRAEGYPFVRRAFDGWMLGAGVGIEERLALARRAAIYERENGDYETAEKSCHVLIAASTKLRGNEDRETLWVRNDLAIVIGNLGDYAGAEKLNRELWEIRKRVFGTDDADTLTSMNNTAVQVTSLSRYREAEKLYRETLALREKVSGPAHAETLRAKSNLGYVLRILGDFDASEKIHKETHDARTAKLGAEHGDTLSSTYELASIAFARGDLARAESLADELVAARERTSGVEHSYTLGAVELLGEILTEKGETAKAIGHLNRVRAGHEKRHKKEHPSVIGAKWALGEAHMAAGDLAAAEPLLRETLGFYTQRLGMEHLTSLHAAMSLGELLAKKKDFAGAEPLLRRALKGGETVLDAQHPFVAECALLLADALANNGGDEARTLAARAVAIAERKLDAKSPLREHCRKLVERLAPK